MILVRHGESEHNAAGRLVGRSDSPLTQRGAEQAAACARLLACEEDLAPLLVVSSPLSRALSTARVVAAALGAAVQVDDRLVELDYGDLEGVSVGAVGAGTWATWRSDSSWRPPGGETLAEVQERVRSFCEDRAAQAAAGTVVAVSHVSPIKAAACWALDAAPELTWRMTLPVASITRISTEPAAMRSFGETGHLLQAGLASEPLRKPSRPSAVRGNPD
jgi:broad specificity phosphatase PhoE